MTGTDKFPAGGSPNMQQLKSDIESILVVSPVCEIDLSELKSDYEIDTDNKTWRSNLQHQLKRAGLHLKTKVDSETEKLFVKRAE